MTSNSDTSSEKHPSVIMKFGKQDNGTYYKKEVITPSLNPNKPGGSSSSSLSSKPISGPSVSAMSSTKSSTVSNLSNVRKERSGDSITTSASKGFKVI